MEEDCLRKNPALFVALLSKTGKSAGAGFQHQGSEIKGLRQKCGDAGLSRAGHSCEGVDK